MYKYDPGIMLIKEKVNNHNKFSFKQVFSCNIIKEIKDIEILLITMLIWLKGKVMTHSTLAPI